MENLNFEHNGNKLIARFEGKLNLETAAEFGREIRDFVDENNIDDLILDFSKIDYISSIGIRILVELNQKMATPKKSLTITNTCSQVIEALRMTGLDKYLKIN